MWMTKRDAIFMRSTEFVTSIVTVLMSSMNPSMDDSVASMYTAGFQLVQVILVPKCRPLFPPFLMFGY